MSFRTVFVLWVAAALISAESPADGNSVSAFENSINVKLQLLFEKFERLEGKVNRIIERQNDRRGLDASLNEGDRLRNILSQLAASSQSGNEESAQVPHPIAIATINKSQVLTCESKGYPLRSCLWVQAIVGGQRQGIFVDGQVVLNGGRTDAAGVFTVGNGLDNGNCSIKIESVTQNDMGRWSCSLLSKAGMIFRGEVNVEQRGKRDPSESSQASYEEFAQVPHPIVCATLNTSQVSTFESKGHPLRLCVWGRIITSGGQWETILIDEQTVRNSGWTPVYGIYYVGNGLDDGNCSISIESVAQRDIGTWSCTLLSKAGTVFQGEVDVHDVETTGIYYTTRGGSLKKYSLVTSKVSTISSSEDWLGGLAYDSFTRKLYFCGLSKIFKADLDGSNRVTALSTREYGDIYGMAFDWVTGNIYVGTLNGNIVACNTKQAGTLTCATVMSTQGSVYGIALNPNQGAMYYTMHLQTARINKGDMDGSNSVTVVTSLSSPQGITIDFETSRLFWTDHA